MDTENLDNVDIYYKCTACSECFMAEDVFFVHTRMWHCKILVCQGQDSNMYANICENSCSATMKQSGVEEEMTMEELLVNIKEETKVDNVDPENIGEVNAISDARSTLSNSKDETEPPYINTTLEELRENDHDNTDNLQVELADTAAEVNKSSRPHQQELVQWNYSPSLIPKQHKCRICYRSMPSKTSLRHHMRSHQRGFDEYVINNGNQPMQTFVEPVIEVPDNETVVKKRLATTKPVQNKFSRVTMTQRHTRSPSQNKQIRKQFVQQSGQPLEYTVMNYQRYCCTKCTDTFGTAAGLKYHMTSKHTDEKRFPCSVCGQCFARQYVLTCHIRTHTGERPYKCELCHKAFAQLGTLHRHKQVHKRV